MTLDSAQTAAPRSSRPPRRLCARRGSASPDAAKIDGDRDEIDFLNYHSAASSRMHCDCGQNAESTQKTRERRENRSSLGRGGDEDDWEILGRRLWHDHTQTLFILRRFGTPSTGDTQRDENKELFTFSCAASATFSAKFEIFPRRNQRERTPTNFPRNPTLFSRAKHNFFIPFN